MSWKPIWTFPSFARRIFCPVKQFFFFFFFLNKILNITCTFDLLVVQQFATGDYEGATPWASSPRMFELWNTEEDEENVLFLRVFSRSRWQSIEMNNPPSLVAGIILLALSESLCPNDFSQFDSVTVTEARLRPNNNYIYIYIKKRVPPVKFDRVFHILRWLGWSWATGNLIKKSQSSTWDERSKSQTRAEVHGLWFGASLTNLDFLHTIIGWKQISSRSNQLMTNVQCWKMRFSVTASNRYENNKEFDMIIL